MRKSKEKKSDTAREIDVSLLGGHPLNRSFPIKGEDWDDFCDSIRTHGVVESLFVRPLERDGKKYEVLAGHRRLTAARKVGLDFVPCQVLELDDRQALVFLINSNLQRENLNLVQEAELVRELKGLGMDEEQILHDLNRAPEWLEVRQSVFEFDYAVMEALQKGKLSEGAFREVLWAPKEIRERALQVVMGGGEHHDEPLSADRAREYIQFSLIPDWEKETEWEEGREKVRKAVTKEIKKLCQGTENEATVLVLPWGKGAEGLGGDLVNAKDLVPEEYIAEGKEPGKTWAWCAARVGAPVYVIAPDTTHHDKRLLVSRRVLLDDAAAREAHGMEPLYLAAKEKAKKSKEVEAAVAALDGEGEKDYDEAEPVSQVATTGAEDGIKIEQSIEHHAWMDLGAVTRLREWAKTWTPATEKPEWVPSWAYVQFLDGYGASVIEACEWFASLKK